MNYSFKAGFIRRYPPCYVKWVPRKALYKCNKLIQSKSIFGIRGLKEKYLHVPHNLDSGNWSINDLLTKMFFAYR